MYKQNNVNIEVATSGKGFRQREAIIAYIPISRFRYLKMFGNNHSIRDINENEKLSHILIKRLEYYGDNRI